MWCGLVSLVFFEIFVSNGTVVVIWVVAVAFFLLLLWLGWCSDILWLFCLCEERRGEERIEALFFVCLFVCLWEGVVAVSCGFFGSWGFFFPPLFGVKETKRKKRRRRRRRRRRESMQ